MNRYINPHFEKQPTKPKKKKSGKKSGFHAPYLLSQELQAVVHGDRMSRPQVVKALWKYIKGNKLQDPTNGRIIVCDDTLAKVLKTDRIDMMKMNKILSDHFVKKVPEEELEAPTAE